VSLFRLCLRHDIVELEGIAHRAATAGDQHHGRKDQDANRGSNDRR
jgi:hypothetical protein